MCVIFCSYLQAKLNALIESLQADLKKVSTSDIENSLFLYITCNLFRLMVKFVREWIRFYQ